MLFRSFFQLKTQDQATSEKFVKSLRLFEWGTSMASVVSSVAIPYYGSHLSLDATEKTKMGLNPGLIRLSFGLETPKDLMGDLSYGFEQISK